MYKKGKQSKVKRAAKQIYFNFANSPFLFRTFKRYFKEDEKWAHVYKTG